MKRLLFVGLMMVCSVSWAGWELTSKSDAFANYHDKSTIRRNDITAQMWVMYDFSEVRTNADGDRYKSSKSLLAYNCKYETLTLISVLQYSGSLGTGDVVMSDTVDESDWVWDRIVPNTPIQIEWSIACGKK